LNEPSGHIINLNLSDDETNLRSSS